MLETEELFGKNQETRQCFLVIHVFFKKNGASVNNIYNMKDGKNCRDDGQVYEAQQDAKWNSRKVFRAVPPPTCPNTVQVST